METRRVIHLAKEESSKFKTRYYFMSQNTRKQPGGPKVEEGFPLWRSQTASRRNRLLEFRAGKMFVRGNMVHPDIRKGLVYIYQDDEGVVHFCWMDRSRGVVEVDLITMPADCSYKRIEKCTTGRVYMLKMRSNGMTSFYWMQEPSAANDLHICNRVNSLLNFPPPRMLFPEQIFNNELQFILNQLNSEQLHALYNGDDIVWTDARNQPSATAEEVSGQPPPIAPPPLPDPYVNLGEVINEESIKTITRNPVIMKKLGDKLPPIGGEHNANLEATVKSHQFKLAIEDFSMALKQGISGPLLRELNVNSAAVAAADKGDVESFIKALQGRTTEETSSQKKSGPPPGPGSAQTSRKTKDPNHANSGKDGEGKETTQEEQKSNSKHTSGETKKRAYDSISMKVNSAQQTEPIKIKSLVQSVGPEMKISRRLAMVHASSDNDSGLEKGQNTDPVLIEDDKISCFNSTSAGYVHDNLASGNSPSSTVQRNVQLTQRQVTVKINDVLESEELPRPNESENITTDEVKKIESKTVTDKSAGMSEIVAPSSNQMEGRGIILRNEYQQMKREAIMKRVNADILEKKAPVDEAGTKKIKLNQSLESTPKHISIEEELTHYQRETGAMPRKRALEETDGTEQEKGAETKRIKLDNRFGGTALSGGSIEAHNCATEENDRGVNKVEGEQQTEPVRIKSAPSAGTETKITTKRPSARGPRNDGSMERSQNTDPVLIEEKHKQSKTKDPNHKPPGQE
ncbi:hypothetical protein GE061_015426 [Apolygus lucorum]|uniref:Proteasomal ubiquitin receptor ADRM1 homolog n=1 Tax=Apolygus lucorum TaxID=248454 RepID=A0A8S9XL18_APOLU|nr:hypothetical protein GE061_015426 [Apolygus lucorum]